MDNEANLRKEIDLNDNYIDEQYQATDEDVTEYEHLNIYEKLAHPKWKVYYPKF